MKRPGSGVRAVAAGLSVVLVFEAAVSPVAQASLWSDRAVFLSRPAPISPPSFVSPAARACATRFDGLVARIAPASGRVRRIENLSGEPHQPVVVHIQDIHGDADAQSRIGRLVRELTAGGVVPLVALEGAWGPVDLGPFRRFPDKPALSGAADYLLREGRISGAAREALAGSPADFVGVEDEALYRANVRAYLASRPLESAAKDGAAERLRVLERRRDAELNAGLADFDRSVASFRAGRAPLSATVRAYAAGAPDVPADARLFLEAVEMEERLDLARVEAERDALLRALTPGLDAALSRELLALAAGFRAGQASPAAMYGRLAALCRRRGIDLERYPAFELYLRYTLLCDRIDGEALFRAIETLEARGYDRGARTEPERALVRELRAARLEAKLADFSLTPTEWNEYRRLAPGRAELRPFESFYVTARARDAAMADRLLSAMRERGTNAAVLVTGGFHAAPIAERVTASGAAVVSVIPSVTKADEARGSAYLSVFAREKTPLDRLFEGQKLFLAAPPLSPLARRLAIAVSYMLSAVRLSGRAPPFSSVYPLSEGVSVGGYASAGPNAADFDVDVDGARDRLRLSAGPAGVNDLSPSPGPRRAFVRGWVIAVELASFAVVAFSFESFVARAAVLVFFALYAVWIAADGDGRLSRWTGRWPLSLRAVFVAGWAERHDVYEPGFAADHPGATEAERAQIEDNRRAILGFTLGFFAAALASQLAFGLPLIPSVAASALLSQLAANPAAHTFVNAARRWVIGGAMAAKEVVSRAPSGLMSEFLYDLWLSPPMNFPARNGTFVVVMAGRGESAQPFISLARDSRFLLLETDNSLVTGAAERYADPERGNRVDSRIFDPYAPDFRIPAADGSVDVVFLPAGTDRELSEAAYERLFVEVARVLRSRMGRLYIEADDINAVRRAAARLKEVRPGIHADALRPHANFLSIRFLDLAGAERRRVMTAMASIGWAASLSVQASLDLVLAMTLAHRDPELRAEFLRGMPPSQRGLIATLIDALGDDEIRAETEWVRLADEDDQRLIAAAPALFAALDAAGSETLFEGQPEDAADDLVFTVRRTPGAAYTFDRSAPSLFTPVSPRPAPSVQTIRVEVREIRGETMGELVGFLVGVVGADRPEIMSRVVFASASGRHWDELETLMGRALRPHIPRAVTELALVLRDPVTLAGIVGKFRSYVDLPEIAAMGGLPGITAANLIDYAQSAFDDVLGARRAIQSAAFIGSAALPAGQLLDAAGFRAVVMRDQPLAWIRDPDEPGVPLLIARRSRDVSFENTSISREVILSAEESDVLADFQLAELNPRHSVHGDRRRASVSAALARVPRADATPSGVSRLVVFGAGALRELSDDIFDEGRFSEIVVNDIGVELVGRAIEMRARRLGRALTHVRIAPGSLLAINPDFERAVRRAIETAEDPADAGARCLRLLAEWQGRIALAPHVPGIEPGSAQAVVSSTVDNNVFGGLVVSIDRMIARRFGIEVDWETLANNVFMDAATLGEREAFVAVEAELTAAHLRLLRETAAPGGVIYYSSLRSKVNMARLPFAGVGFDLLLVMLHQELRRLAGLPYIAVPRAEEILAAAAELFARRDRGPFGRMVRPRPVLTAPGDPLVNVLEGVEPLDAEVWAWMHNDEYPSVVESVVLRRREAAPSRIEPSGEVDATADRWLTLLPWMLVGAGALFIAKGNWLVASALLVAAFSAFPLMMVGTGGRRPNTLFRVVDDRLPPAQKISAAVLGPGADLAARALERDLASRLRFRSLSASGFESLASPSERKTALSGLVDQSQMVVMLTVQPSDADFAAWVEQADRTLGPLGVLLFAHSDAGAARAVREVLQFRGYEFHEAPVPSGYPKVPAAGKSTLLIARKLQFDPSKPPPALDYDVDLDRIRAILEWDSSYSYRKKAKRTSPLAPSEREALFTALRAKKVPEDLRQEIWRQLVIVHSSAYAVDRKEALDLLSHQEERQLKRRAGTRRPQALSAKHQRVLFRALHATNVDSAERKRIWSLLVETNTGIAAWMALRMRTAPGDIEDTVQDGILYGLMGDGEPMAGGAVWEFEWWKGAFSTVATMLTRQGIQSAQDDGMGRRSSFNNRAEEARRQFGVLTMQLGREPRLEEFAKFINTKVETARQYLLESPHSIDATINGHDELAPGDMLESPERPPEFRIEAREEQVRTILQMAELRELLARLSPMYQLVLKLSLGIGTRTVAGNDGEEMPIMYGPRQIGRFLGISHESVRQYRDRAMKMLRGEVDFTELQDGRRPLYYAGHQDVRAVELIHALPDSPDWDELMGYSADELTAMVRSGELKPRRFRKPAKRGDVQRRGGLTMPAIRAAAIVYFTDPDRHPLLRWFYRVWPRAAIGWYAAFNEVEWTLDFWRFAEKGHDNVDDVDWYRRVIGTALIWLAMAAAPLAAGYGLAQFFGFPFWSVFVFGFLLARPLMRPANILAHGLINTLDAMIPMWVARPAPLVLDGEPEIRFDIAYDINDTFEFNRGELEHRDYWSRLMEPSLAEFRRWIAERTAHDAETAVALARDILLNALESVDLDGSGRIGVVIRDTGRRLAMDIENSGTPVDPKAWGGLGVDVRSTRPAGEGAAIRVGLRALIAAVPEAEVQIWSRVGDYVRGWQFTRSPTGHGVRRRVLRDEFDDALPERTATRVSIYLPLPVEPEFGAAVVFDGRGVDEEAAPVPLFRQIERAKAMLAELVVSARRLSDEIRSGKLVAWRWDADLSALEVVLDRERMALALNLASTALDPFVRAELNRRFEELSGLLVSQEAMPYSGEVCALLARVPPAAGALMDLLEDISLRLRESEGYGGGDIFSTFVVWFLLGAGILGWTFGAGVAADSGMLLAAVPLFAMPAMRWRRAAALDRAADAYVAAERRLFDAGRLSPGALSALLGRPSVFADEIGGRGGALSWSTFSGDELAEAIRARRDSGPRAGFGAASNLLTAVIPPSIPEPAGVVYDKDVFYPTIGASRRVIADNAARLARRLGEGRVLRLAVDGSAGGLAYYETALAREIAKGLVSVTAAPERFASIDPDGVFVVSGRVVERALRALEGNAILALPSGAAIDADGAGASWLRALTVILVGEAFENARARWTDLLNLGRTARIIAEKA